jgi:outer membrane protein assembly factor BamB
MASRWKLVLAAAWCLTAAGCDGQMWSSSVLTHDSVLAKAGLANYWQLDLQLPPGESIVKLILIEENLYCLTASNCLLAVDAASGVRKWSHQVAEKGVTVFAPCHGTKVPIDPNVSRVVPRDIGPWRGTGRNDPNLPGVVKILAPLAPASLPAKDLVLINTPDYVLALDRMTGEEVRKISFAQYQPSSFVANTGGGCDGTYFHVGTANGDVKSIRINEGVVAWSYQAGSIMSGDLKSVLSNEGNVNKTKTDKSLQTMESVAWSYRGWSIISASPQCLPVTGASPRIYVATGEGDLAILKSGSLLSMLWPLTTRNWPPTKGWNEGNDMAGAVVAGFHVDDRAAFIPCLNKRVYAFGLAGGQPLWRFTTEGQLHDDIQVSENSVFQYSRGDKFYALDVSSGKSRWSMRQGRRVLAAMPSKGVPMAYLVDNARNLLVVDEILGKIQVTIPLTGVNLFADNTSATALYLGNTAGRLVCLRQIGAEHLTPDTLKKAKAEAKATTKATTAPAK